MTTNLSKKRDTQVIIFALRCLKTELDKGIIPKKWQVIRAWETESYINGFWLGSPTCTNYKHRLAEIYLNKLKDKYKLRNWDF